MPAIRVTTFNLENLFNRYALLDVPWEDRSYEKIVQAVGLASVASRAGDLVSYETTAVQRDNTGRAVLDSKPDILAVQEVENLYTLRIFNKQYLKSYFDRMILIDGNDPRGIDVGFLVRKGFAGQITGIQTHVDEGESGKAVIRGPGGPQTAVGYPATNALFSRDCLSVDVAIAGKTITFLVNHLKAQDGTETADSRRQRQAKRVAALAAEARKQGKLPIVLGDLNADVADAQQNKNKAKKRAGESLLPLLNAPGLVDVFGGTAENWTHYYESDDSVSRLDYVLVDKQLTVSGTEILRQGLSLKCEQTDAARYPTIGLAHTEASDHCPVTAVIEV
ncbi:MAG TPA: endonuclease/exonuclease/phosphatase family protein [Candidatus Margulisiibacteriota bacterium]|nr:endonuclease/exonuclease/phosphatase family protein [Candidatus Margulisiibacteriota bacterium]